MFFSIFSFFLSIFSVYSYHWSGDILYDLEFQGLNFVTEAEAWTCIATLVTTGVKTTECGSDTILGGYNIMGPEGSRPTGAYWYRTYEDLPSHNTVKLQVTVYPVDSWDGTSGDDHFEITIDSTNFVLWSLETYDSSVQPVSWAPTNICGSSDWNDLPPMTTYITMAHSASTLTLELINGLNGVSNAESVGFRGVILTFSTESSAVTTSYCGITSSGYPLSDHICSCGSGTTMTYTDSGLCGTCDASCATCNTASSSSCLSCAAGDYLSDGSCLECTSTCATCSGDADFCISCETDYGLIDSTCYLCEDPLVLTLSGGVYYCQSPCDDDEHVLWDGSCTSSCDSPLVVETVGAYSLCTFPCEDETMHYYTWNGSCISGCPSPLSESSYLDRYFCNYDCEPDEYLYWNGSCMGSCPSPLGAEIQGAVEQRNFCWYTCQTDEYLYWNGSCLGSCPTPLSAEIQGSTDQRNFCWYLCQPDKYLYWNGSCVDTCPSPLSSEIQGESVERNFCWYTCQPDEYLYWNGSCVSECPSPLSGEVQGTTDQRNFCWYICQPDEYLYWNRSCLSTCPYPLSEEIQGTTVTRKFCWYTCKPTEYLYWNGSCVSECPSPLSQETQGTYEERNFCWYTCQPEQYLYWNMSCLNTCPSPLSPETQGTTDQRNFCWYTCQPDQYLYWNLSCINTCPSPLSSETQGTVEQRNFCWFPCRSGGYLYWNESCSSACPLPLMTVNDPDISYCFLPCGYPNIYWYKNTSCLSNCDYPYNIIPYSEVLQCLSPCEDSEYFYDQEGKCYSSCNYPYKKQMIDVIKICHLDYSVTLDETEDIVSDVETIKTQGAITSGAMKAASALSSSSPTSALLAGLSAMLQYIRYMDINYPPKVQVLFLVSADDPISLGFDFEIPSWIEDKLVDYDLPEVFEKYDINSNFVNNLWDFLMTLAVNFLAIFAFFLLDFISRRFSKINKVIAKVLQVMKWNTPLAMICSSSGDIFFYSSLQFQSSPLNSAASIICFIVCLIMIGFVVIISVIILKIVKGFQMQRRGDTSESEDWKEKWSNWGILFVEYEEKTVLTVGYMLLFILRGMIFNLTIANLYDFPLLQSIIINIANLSMFGYILYLRPLKELLGVVQLFVTEGIVNIVSICVLILAIMDKANIDGETTRVGVGDVMVFLIKAFNTSALVFMGISMLLFLMSAYNIWKLLRAQGIKSPLKMLEKIFFGDLEEEIVKAAGFTSSLARIIIKKPKIRRPPRKEKPISQGVNNVIQLESITNSAEDLPAEISMINSGGSFLRTRSNTLKSQLRHLNQLTGELEITDLDTTQTVLEQDLRESPERPFRGLDETVLEEIKNLDGSGVFEKKGSEAENVLSTEETSAIEPPPSGKIDMFESLRQLKARMRRFGRIDFRPEDQQWYDKLRKLKARLRGRPKRAGISLENHSESL